MTNRFLMTVLSIVFIVILVNIILFFAFLFWQSRNTSTTSVGDAVINTFQPFVTVENNELIVDEEGLIFLQENNSWVQFLDENGHVVKSYFTNDIDAPTHYTPVELIHHYKNRVFDNDTVLYFKEAAPYTILVGVKDPSITRQVITVDSNFVISLISNYLLLIIIVDLVVAILAGLLFGSILTKPLYKMTDRIQQLKNQHYNSKEKVRPGIYKHVFENLEDVAHDLSKQEVERQKLEKMRNDWISNVSHDMKTPLASIQGYAELLIDDDVTDAERKNYAAVIERQSIYMHELLEDFMLTTRLRNNELPLQTEIIPAERFVQNVVIDFLNDAQFQETDVQFTVQQSATIEIDVHLMKRALLNFLINAAIHNPPETTIFVTVATVDKQLSIEIRDNGLGISPEHLPNIFERYYRGTNTSDIKGSGLGMAISRDICRAHHGEVTIKSAVGTGTSITMLLPHIAVQ